MVIAEHTVPKYQKGEINFTQVTQYRHRCFRANSAKNYIKKITYPYNTRKQIQWQYLITLDTLRPGQNCHHFPNDIFRCIFLFENVSISIKISLKFVPNGPINNILALVQIMARCRSDDKPFSEQMMVGLPAHIYVTRPQWVKMIRPT